MKNFFKKLPDIISKPLKQSAEEMKKSIEDMGKIFSEGISKPKEHKLPILKSNAQPKEITIKDLKPGDILVAVRLLGMYLHYGVYVGDGEVVYFSYHKGEKMRDTRIILTSYKEFEDGSPTYREPVREGMTPNSREETVRIAKSYVNNDFNGYKLFKKQLRTFCQFLSKQHQGFVSNK